jgi:transposase
VREAIEARGASLWFLPSYSPDLNPIELAFSKLKRLLRSTAAPDAVVAQQLQELQLAIGEIDRELHAWHRSCTACGC